MAQEAEMTVIGMDDDVVAALPEVQLKRRSTGKAALNWSVFTLL